jgi:hypothetical protein|tara:strand:+ start:3853 stop:4095 length:243 start_codon:yes stop_codon:yes gene_type:complete
VSTVEPLNTNPIQQFISQVKGADASNQKELKMNIDQARRLAFTLGEVMARLNGDLEQLLARKNSGADDVIQINMDGGSKW